MDLREASQLGGEPERHWYYQTKSYPLFDEMRTVLSAHGDRPIAIADVGAGEGLFTKALVTRYPGAISRAHLIDAGYPSDGTETFGGVPLERARTLPARLDARFIMLMDVLEHVSDDLDFLASVVSKTPAGASFFITVPAFRILWSSHDDYLGHLRRYRLNELAALCERAGLAVHARFYFFASIFPAVLALRLLRKGDRSHSSDLQPAPPTVEALLKKLLRAESVVCRANRLFGVTAVVCARRM